MSDQNLVTCPLCKQEECCNIEPINEFHNKYACMSCGFETNDLMRLGEFDVDSYEEPEDFPSLYKDIKQVDENGRVWYPMTINVQGKGTVYAFGTDKEDWRWRAIKSIPLTEEESTLPRYKNATHKSDSSTETDFGKDFFSAVDYINIFDI